MRIAICGPNRDEVISKVEKTLNVSAKNPWGNNGESTIIDQAAETYKYFNESNVVFAGSAFDFLVKESAEGYDDVYEQIALCTLDNLDYIAVIVDDMDKNTLKMYYEYQKLFPSKFYVYRGVNDFELVLR